MTRVQQVKVAACLDEVTSTAKGEEGRQEHVNRCTAQLEAALDDAV